MKTIRTLAVSSICALAITIAVGLPANAYTEKVLSPTLPSGTATGTVKYSGGLNPNCQGYSASSASQDYAYTSDALLGCTWVATTHWYRPAGQTTYYKTYTGLKGDYAGTTVKRELISSVHAIWV